MSDDRQDSLPTWWFEVDEVDDIDTNISLLQELEIDLPHIYRCTIWMLLCPLGCFCGRHSGKHPLSTMLAPHIGRQNSDPDVSMSNINLPGLNNLNFAPAQIDFWGPCSIVSLFGALLWLDKVRNVGWLYVIWSLASLFNHFICRVFFKPSRLMIHCALLGYSVTPLIPIGGIIMLFHPPIWLCTVLEIIAVIWASLAAFLSYLTIFNTTPEVKKRLSLILPSVVLMELYLISLIPIRPPR